MKPRHGTLVSNARFLLPSDIGKFIAGRKTAIECFTCLYSHLVSWRAAKHEHSSVLLLARHAFLGIVEFLPVCVLSLKYEVAASRIRDLA